jgi:spore germination protein GerM
MSDKKKNTGFALACWLLVALILLIFFLVKKDTIVTNLQKTDFFNRVFGSTPEFVKQHEPKQKEQQPEEDFFQIDLTPPKTSEKSEQTETSEELATSSDNEIPSQEEVSKNDTTITDTKEPTKTTENTKTEKPQSTVTTQKEKPTENLTTTASLYFVVVDSDGSIVRKVVKRKLPKTDSPLTNAINALLAGPTPEETNKNCMTLIPEGTKLLGASVKNGVATLNFSENLNFNPNGVEGYIGQLMQIVYTATEFSTVKSVQFQIEGKTIPKLETEHEIWIGSPLARSSFN